MTKLIVAFGNFANAPRTPTKGLVADTRSQTERRTLSPHKVFLLSCEKKAV